MITFESQLNLLWEASGLCAKLSEQIIELTETKEWAEKTHDLNTWLGADWEYERLERIWKKADKRYNRRLQAVDTSVLAA